ncbi:MAG TPA: hypothetical protein VD866_24305 [Urbifossiella sp.]|nr:hypothetical protein [Urbifossiella sp.]
MPTDPQPDLDPAESDLIRIKARVLARRGVISRADVADTRQDLAVALLAARPGFDPGRGTKATYTATVVAHATAKVARGRYAAKRHPGRVVRLAYLDAEPADPGGDPTGRAVVALDVAAVIEVLPPDLREVAEALKAGTVAAAARALGVPRTTVHERVHEIRSWFERAGLGGDR